MLRIRFRSTFLVTLLALVGSIAFLIGATSYYSAKVTAQDLSRQVLEQTSARVDNEVRELTTSAIRVSGLNKRLIEHGMARAHDFAWLVPYWTEVLRGETGLSSVFVGVEATGESSGVSQLGGRLSIWESTRATDHYEVREYYPEAYARTPYAFDPTKPGPDIRTRPWYVGARDARRPFWTDTYTFLGVKGQEAVAGITYATPLYGASGELLGVLSADFGLARLSEFLATVRVARTGFACVIETRADGTRQLIAHPRGAAAKDDPRVRPLLAASPNAAEFTPLAFDVDGASYLGGVRPIGGDDAPRWQIAVVVPEDEVLGRVTRSTRISIGIALAGLALAVGCGLYVARQVARPLEALSYEMDAISELRLDPRPVAHSIILEVDRVAVAAEDIKTGLRQKRVLEKYVPQGARDDIAQNRAGDVALGGERVRRTILFSDLRGFTSMSERLPPDAVVRLLNEYLEAMTAVILANGGDINEYIGDAILAVFACTPDAVGAAIAMQRALAALRDTTQDPEVRTLRMGIGLHVGDVVEGNIGTTERVKFGVVGDTVNLAARIQDKSREGTRTAIFVSAAVRAEAPGFDFAPVGDLTLKGKAVPVAVYEVT